MIDSGASENGRMPNVLRYNFLCIWRTFNLKKEKKLLGLLLLPIIYQSF